MRQAGQMRQMGQMGQMGQMLRGCMMELSQQQSLQNQQFMESVLQMSGWNPRRTDVPALTDSSLQQSSAGFVGNIAGGRLLLGAGRTPPNTTPASASQHPSASQPCDHGANSSQRNSDSQAMVRGEEEIDSPPQGQLALRDMPRTDHTSKEDAEIHTAKKQVPATTGASAAVSLLALLESRDRSKAGRKKKAKTAEVASTPAATIKQERLCEVEELAPVTVKIKRKKKSVLRRKWQPSCQPFLILQRRIFRIASEGGRPRLPRKQSPRQSLCRRLTLRPRQLLQKQRRGPDLSTGLRRIQSQDWAVQSADMHPGAAPRA